MHTTATTTSLTKPALACPAIFAGKRVLVVGLGTTGLSVVRFLQQRHVQFAVTDSRVQPPGLKTLQDDYPDVPVFLGEFNPQVFEHVDVLVVSPGVARSTPVIAACEQRGAEILGDIEIFARCTQQPVIAITGSNGKSTVTSLVAEMVRQAGYRVGAGANLGTPALTLLEDEPQIYVLELSSFQLETTWSLHAHASTILNISEDHMDRYATIAEYAQAKARIFAGHGVVVANADDPFVMQFVKALPPERQVLCFKLNEPHNPREFGVIKFNGTDWLAVGTEKLLPVSAMKIKGQHNVANALASLALGAAIGLPMNAMLTALQQFPGLAHRSQWVLEKNGINWYNDSKGTNVGASLAAIAGIPAVKLIVILGGLGKEQDFSPLRQPLQQRARHVLLLGKDAKLISAALGESIPKTFVADLDEAILRANELAQQGDAVLLSPACASFDMFKGYEHRGDVFMQRVRDLVA